MPKARITKNVSGSSNYALLCSLLHPSLIISCILLFAAVFTGPPEALAQNQNSIQQQDATQQQDSTQIQDTAQNQNVPQAECQMLEDTFPGLGSGINLDIKMKRPMIMFRETLNKRWRPIPVFLTVFLLALMVKLLPAGLRTAAILSTRSALIPSLSYALVFCAALTVLTRLAFQFQSTVPLALLSLGIMELFFFVGMGLGVNLLCDRLCELLSEKTFPKDSKKRKVMGVLILLLASMLVAALSIIPGLGRLPRLGNRLLVFLAMLGSGGLLRALYKRYDQVDS